MRPRSASTDAKLTWRKEGALWVGRDGNGWDRFILLPSEHMKHMWSLIGTLGTLPDQLEEEAYQPFSKAKKRASRLLEDWYAS